ADCAALVLRGLLDGEKPPEPTEISSATPAAFSARDTGFEPVAFGSGEQKQAIQGVSTGANSSDSLNCGVPDGPKTTPWTAARTAPARHTGGQGPRVRPSQGPQVPPGQGDRSHEKARVSS